MCNRHILVVGGGIGGLCAAMALGRQGLDVTLLEKTAEFAEIGAGLTPGTQTGCSV